MTDKICDIRSGVKRYAPLIHCITNPISINQCANSVLAVGARPIMAEHPGEVAEITRTASALLINLGNITDTRMESMRVSMETASRLGIPRVLDAVGIACSGLRREYAAGIIECYIPSVIKGNYSEICALYDPGYSVPGVDAQGALDTDRIADMAAELAKRHNTVILASGKTDIVTDGRTFAYIKNGTEQLASVTGTGCMLGALCATFLTCADGMDSAVSACAYLGVCGELAKTDRGSGSFMLNLLDRLSTLGEDAISEYLNMEERKI